MKTALATIGHLATLDQAITPGVESWKSSLGEIVKVLAGDSESNVAELLKIDAITCDEERDAAMSQVAEVKGFLKKIEQFREQLKAPILDAGRTLDEAIKEVTAPMLTQTKRLEGLSGSYELEKRRKAQQAEHERLAEIRRAEQVERDAAEAQRRAQEAERLRQQAEQAAQEAKGRKAKQEAEAAALRARQEQEAALKAQQEAQAKADEAAAAADFEPAAAPVITKVSGAAVTETYDFEVEDVTALYEACPRAVELTVKRSVITDMIRAGTRELAGVRIFPTVKVAARAKTSSLLR